MRLPIIPLEVMVNQLAEAMFVNPETTMMHLRAVARHKLTSTTDPLARGLMLGWERHRVRPAERVDRNAEQLEGSKLIGAPGVLRFDPKTGLPKGAVYIGRKMPRHGLPASKWANPFRIDKTEKDGRLIERNDGPRAEVIAKYRDWLLLQPGLMAALPELRGHDLVCWCAPEACHGDLLLQFANGDCDA